MMESIDLESYHPHVVCILVIGDASDDTKRNTPVQAFVAWNLRSIYGFAECHYLWK